MSKANPKTDEAYTASHSMHGRVVAPSPLGEPSEAAKRFLEPADRYDGHVEPSESLSKWAALLEAQRQARELAE